MKKILKAVSKAMMLMLCVVAISNIIDFFAKRYGIDSDSIKGIIALFAGIVLFVALFYIDDD